MRLTRSFELSRATKRKCKISWTILFALLAAGSFSLLLFLIPFIVDPALATILADFTAENVSCLVTDVAFRQGQGNCSWSSCLEGCTRDVYTCFQIRVNYTDLQATPRSGVLLVNARGCGYPPKVKCDSFYEQYEYLMQNNLRFDCYYSQNNGSIVVTEVDLPAQVFNLVMSIGIPLLILIISCLAVTLIHKFVRFKEDFIFQEGLELSPEPEEQDGEDNTVLSGSERGSANLNDMLTGFSGPPEEIGYPGYTESLKRKSDHIELPTLSKRIRRTEILSNFVFESEESRKKIH